MSNQAVTLFELSEELDHIRLELSKAKSLLNFLSDYFKFPEPEAVDLLSRYSMYSDLFHVTDSMVHDQLNGIEAVSDTLNGVYRGDIAMKFNNS